MIKLLLSVSLLLLPAEAFSQINISSLYESYYDDNIFNNSSKVADFINNVSLGAGYNIESTSNNIQFYYMGDFSYFQKNIYKSSSAHKIGFVDTYLFSSDENPLNIGVNYTFKKNRDDFTLFDFNVLSLYANYNHNLNETNILLAGYVFNRNRFDNYSIFSHDENRIFAKYTGSFETKTTIITGIEYDNKNYLNTAEEYSGSQQISQMKYYLQVAQSLTEKTGLSAHALIRKNLNSGTRFITSNDLIYYEEEIFFDNYSNDGYEMGLTLTHLFSSSLKGTIDFNYQTKNFLNLPAVDEYGYETNNFRNDKQIFTSLGVTKEFSDFIKGLYISFSWSFINNSSNDAFYQYNNSIYSISFGWEL